MCLLLQTIQYFTYTVLFLFYYSIAVLIITYHGLGGFGCSDTLKEISMAQYLVNMIGLYHGLDILQPLNIQIEIVSPGCEFHQKKNVPWLYNNNNKI